MTRRYPIGFSWSDIEKGGRTAFPYIHQAGAGVLSAFGAGGLVKPIEQLEQQGGLLPTPPKPDHVVKGADFAIVVRKSMKQPTVIAMPDDVSVFGGKRFDGNGYAGPADAGSKFSFGYDAPTSVDVTAQGKKTSFTDAKQVLLCGGVEQQTNIAGDVMSNKGIIGTILGVLGFSNDEDEYTVGLAPLRTFGAGAPTTAPTTAPTVPSNNYIRGALGVAAAGKPTLRGPVQNSGFVIRNTAKGRTFTSFRINPKRAIHPDKTIANAKIAITRAKQGANAAAAAAAKAKATTAKKVVMGAAVAPKKVVSIARLEQQAKDLSKAADLLSTHLKGYQTKVAANKTATQNAIKNAKRVTHIHGIAGMGEYPTEIVGASWDEIVGASWDEIVGDVSNVLGQMYAPVPDPSRPGYLTDGTPDPNYGGVPGAIDPNTGLPLASGDVTSSVPGPPDYGAGTPPALAGDHLTLSDGSSWPQAGDYAADPGDDSLWFASDPNAAASMGVGNPTPLPDATEGMLVYFDGSHKPQYMDFGTYSTFYGTGPGGTRPDGGMGTPLGDQTYSHGGSGYQWHDDGWWSFRKDDDPGPAGSGDQRLDHQDDVNSAAQLIKKAFDRNWGPFISWPKGTLPGLHFDVSKGAWFWFWDKAPSWARAPFLQAALNDKMTEYKTMVTSGQTDYVNAQLQDKVNAQQAAQQSQQQAVVDAQIAQQQQVADAQAAIQDQQLQQQMAQQQLQQQAAMEQQAEQQAALEAQAQQLQLQYFQQHPEAAFAPAEAAPAEAAATPEEGGGGEPEYGAPTEYGIDWGDSGGAPAESELTQEADQLFPSG